MPSRIQISTLGPSPVFDPTTSRLLSGAHVKIYEANTIDYVTVWQTLAGAATLSQPLTTDTRGRIPGYLDAMQIVDFRINDGPALQTQVPSGSPALGDLVDGPFWIERIGSSTGGIVRHAVVDANYTIGVNDVVVAITALSAPRTITLPAASTVADHLVYIKDESGQGSAHNVTIAAHGAELIEGNATIALVFNYAEVALYSTGSGWSVI